MGKVHVIFDNPSYSTLNLTELDDVMKVATFYVALLCVNVTNVAMLLC